MKTCDKKNAETRTQSTIQVLFRLTINYPRSAFHALRNHPHLQWPGVDFLSFSRLGAVFATLLRRQLSHKYPLENSNLDREWH